MSPESWYTDRTCLWSASFSELDQRNRTLRSELRPRRVSHFNQLRPQLRPQGLDDVAGPFHCLMRLGREGRDRRLLLTHVFVYVFHVFDTSSFLLNLVELSFLRFILMITCGFL